MSTPQDFAQALNQLKEKMAEQTSQLTTKATELKTLETEKLTIGNELKVKEKEILQMKTRLIEIDRKHRQAEEDLTIIRREQSTNNSQLIKLQQDSQKALKK